MKKCFSCNALFQSAEFLCPVCGWLPDTSGGFPAFAPALAGKSVFFNATQFRHIAAVEKEHFWFVSRNRLIRWAVETYFPGTTSFFEIGCGTGNVLAMFRREFPHAALSGSDIHFEALSFASQSLDGVHLMQMDARRIPFVDEFDLIGAFDIIEHVEEDREILPQIAAACKPEGGLLVTVPQHQFLYSVFDKKAGHKRRYSRGEIEAKLAGAGFKVVMASSFTSLLFPVLAISRFFLRGVAETHYKVENELKIGAVANGILKAVMLLETFLIRMGARFPFGGSIIIAAKKQPLATGKCVA